MLTRVHHVGLVVHRLEDGLAFWRDTIGLRVSAEATVPDQGVKAALLPIGRSEIELLEPIDPQGGVAKFLDKRGEGLHHVCFETPDVAAELAAARTQELPLIDQAPRAGLAGTICFLHPKGTHGVLVEFATPPPGAHHHGACGTGAFRGIALREVTARSRDGAGAATTFVTKLGLVRTADAAVAAGGVLLRFVPADGGGEGIAGLVLDVPDVDAAAGALAARLPQRDGALLRLDATRCHGVPLTFARST